MTFGVMYHHFTSFKHPPSQGSINTKQLTLMLSHLQKKYTILSAHDYYEKSLSNTLTATDICLTFDDGLLSQWDVALPVLQEFGLTAFWFIYSSVFEGFIENLEVYRYFRNVCFENMDEFYELFFTYSKGYLNKDETDLLLKFAPENYLIEYPFYTNKDKKFRYMRDFILKNDRYNHLMDKMILDKKINKADIAENLWMTDEHLKSLHEQAHIIGAHSYSHPTRMQGLAKEQQLSEYYKNICHIKKITGSAPVCMAHPCNSYDDITFELLMSLGFRLGYRSNNARKKFSCLEFPREDHIAIINQM